MTNKLHATTIKALNNAGFKMYGSLIMVAGELYPVPMTGGNSKLGNVWNTGTAPGTGFYSVTDKETGETVGTMGTCPVDCEKCYGQCGFYNMPSTKYSTIRKTELLRNHMKEYFEIIEIIIKYENVEKMRLHAVGDFIPGEAKHYYELFKKFPHVIAWTYTKHKITGDIALLDSLENVNIVKSIIPGCGFNFGHVAYIAAVFYKLLRAGKSVYICRCGIDKEQHCENCDGCSKHEYVLFIEHSTDYVAASDYGFNKLKALIESDLNK